MFYILPKQTFTGFADRHIAGAHYIDLPDGTVLAKLRFHNDGAQTEVESHPQVVALPHPSSSETVGDSVAAKLAHLGVTKDHRTFDVARLASKIHPQMRLR